MVAKLVTKTRIVASGTVHVVTRRAVAAAEVRAASYLRAYSFGNYPSDRSEFAMRSHLKMIADDAWEQLENSLDDSNLLFIPLIAVQDDPKNIQDLVSKGIQLNVPAEGKNEYVVGTLDVTIGYRLLAEELIGHLPKGDPSTSSKQRAYLSNVCVLKSARRGGVAKSLIEDACSIAFDHGVKHMYVHVVEDNIPARSLYESKCGFEVEQQESASFARLANRPKRLLMHRELQ